MASATNELIIKYRADITELQQKIGTLNKNLKGLETTSNKVTDGISSGFSKLTTIIASTFAVERLIQFGKISVQSFLEAELSAKKLQTAVSVNGGLQKDFDRLIEQSKELQAITIFNDEDIQNAQTIGLQFGLTADQVEKLLPVIADFASATGQSLQGALEGVLRGSEGAARGLKIYGISVTEGLTKGQQLANITDQLNAKFKGQAEIVGNTTTGAIEKLKNKYNDFQEVVGESIVSIGEVTASMILLVANGFKPVEDASDSATGKLKLTTDQVKLMQQQFDTITLLSLQSQLENLNKVGGSSDAIKNITDRLKEFSAKSFNAEIQSLDVQGLEDKLKEVQNASTFIIPKAGDLSNNDRIKILAQEIQARKAAGKLIKDQNKVDASDLAAIEKERLAAEEAAAKQRTAIASKNADNAFQLALLAIERQEQAEIALEERSAQEKLLIQIKYAEARRDLIFNTEYDTVAIAKANNDIFKLNVQLNDQKLKDAKETTEGLIAQNERRTAAEITEAERRMEVERQEAAAKKQLQEASRDFIIQIFRQVSDERVSGLQDEKERSQENSDEELSRLEDLRSRDMISLMDYNAQKDALNNKRKQDDDRINKAIREEKRKQAIIEKSLAIFEGTINLAKAISVALSSAPPPFNAVLASISAALAGIQLAAIIATPIPQFAKGTKSAGGALSLVGEEGPELMFVPQAAKILSAGTTKKYSALIDAMHDNQLQQHLDKFYIAPALNKQRLLFEQFKDQSFAANVANSFMLQAGGITANEMDFIRRKGTYLRNADELAVLIAKEVAKAIPQQSARRYNA